MGVRTMKLSKRVSAVQPSVTMAVTAKAKKLKAEGVDVIGFGAGEPDFDTPQRIKDAAKKAIDDGVTKYTPAGGTDELKKAVVEKFKRENGLEYDISRVTINCGAKHSIYNVCQAIINPGDELIIPSPYWVSYPEFANLAEGKPVFVDTDYENGFDLDIGAIERAVSKKTAALVVNSPSNPTGAVYSEEKLKAVADLAAKHDFLVISDEIYEHLVYDGKEHFSIASISDEIKERTILINGVSKAYSMTGWRIGYTAAATEISKAIGTIQSHSTSNPASISQKASVEALLGPQDEVGMMRAEFEKRRDYIVERLNKMAEVSCHKPGGAFYVFPCFKDLMGRSFGGKKIENTLDLADYLLSECKIAPVPGEGFGAAGYMRFSYAASMEDITQGMDRLEEGVAQLK